MTKVTPSNYKEVARIDANVKKSIIVYHANSNTYYSGVTRDVIKYFERLFSDFASTGKHVPDIVKRMIERGGPFEFYYVVFHTRKQVADELDRSGVRKVHTAPGTCITKPIKIYEVHSLVFGLSRYVSCEETDNQALILKQANESLVRWLTNSTYVGSSSNSQLNHVFRFELQQKPKVIFKEENSTVRECGQWSSLLYPKQFRTEVTRLNTLAVQEFVRKTCTARR